MSGRATQLGRGGAALLALVLAILLAPSAGAATLERTQAFEIGAGARATGLAAGPDDNLWFTGPRYLAGSANVVGRLTPSGGLSEFALQSKPPLGGEIANGHDGNLWFTDPAANTVGRVTPLGQIDEFAVPSAAAGLGAIAAGPGGAAWFVEEAAGKVGKVTPAGAVTEFPLPAGARPSGIAEGPDGALWIVESGLARIARMTAAGALTEYPLPDPASVPHTIVSAPDGNLWFSEESAPRVGRITPAGEVSEFRISSDRGTRALVVGGDGNLWFSTGYAIGSISTTGELGEPACVDRACTLPVNDLAKGPEGEIWFAGGLRRTEAGGGTAQLELGQPGLVGRFLAPALSVRLGRGASRVHGGLTTIAFSCHGGAAGEACKGALKLSAKIGGRTVQLSRHRYELQPTTGRRLPLGVGFRGASALKKRGKLLARVTATLEDGSSASRKLVLRAPGRKR